MMKVTTLSAWLVMLLTPDSFTNRAAAVKVGKAWNTALSTMPSNWLNARGFRATAFMMTGSCASLDSHTTYRVAVTYLTFANRIAFGIPPLPGTAMAGVLHEIAVRGLFANVVLLVVAMAFGGVEGNGGRAAGALVALVVVGNGRDGRG